MPRVPTVAFVSLVACVVVACAPSTAAGKAACSAASPFTIRADARVDEPRPPALPVVGEWAFRVLSPRVLELQVVLTEPPGGRPTAWDWARDNQPPCLPAPTVFDVQVADKGVPVRSVGFRRRPVYAPLGRRDLRIGASLLLELAGDVAEGATVRVRDATHVAWTGVPVLEARADPHRWSQAIHVDQAGYVPGLPKKALVGRYLGTLGELAVDAAPGFRVVDDATGAQVFFGTLAPRADHGWADQIEPYQRVLEADFSELRRPGRYRVEVPGLGSSWPFDLDDGVAAAFTRAYALGLYHQRCGAANELPFTRFTHHPCHRMPAEVPTSEFGMVERRLAGWQQGHDPSKQQAPPMTGVEASLFPFVRPGPLDVSGGHHDAGDYSKYTPNSAQLIHNLVFAADAFPGAGDLDNLGLPESGDGKSDLLQIAKWEADFLLKMQDDDGGFYSLVYPRDRPYELDALPDHGDPQVVFPKNTAVTAAAVAALAQLASSPRFLRDSPAAAPPYLDAAKKGWAFLQRAFAKYGRHGAYQRVMDYGDRYQDDDEVAWAATELFLATGDPSYHGVLRAEFDPADPETLYWSWLRLHVAYGNAIRSYAFADRTRLVAADRLDATHLTKCREQVRLLGTDMLDRARGSGYRTSFPFEAKRFRNAGWYFSAENAYDLLVAWLLDPRPELLEAAVGNLDFTAGANPLDTSFVGGLGHRWPRELVSQFALNDARALPPSGIPSADVVSEFAWLDKYKEELRKVGFPSTDDRDNPVPMFDRWGDSFNTTSEVTVPVLARCLGAAAFLMARTPVRHQPWRAATARIEGVPARVTEWDRVSATLVVDGLDLSRATIDWEASGREPIEGPTLVLLDSRPGHAWIEAEARWVDGRRAFARFDYDVFPRTRPAP